MPEAIRVESIPLVMAERADVIVDFSLYPDGTELFLENIGIHTDGRRLKEVDPTRPTRLVEFIVEGDPIPGDVTVAPGTPLRPHDPITEADLVGTRVFEFVRRNGAWQTNNQFFNPRRADAVPVRDPAGIKAERWILRNNSNG